MDYSIQSEPLSLLYICMKDGYMLTRGDIYIYMHYICTDRCVHVNNVHTDECRLAKSDI